MQFVFQLRFASGFVLAAVARGEFTLNSAVFAGAAGWLAATWAIYLMNGIADVVEDRVNGSTRPIARGSLPVTSATVTCFVLSVGALGCCVLVSFRMVVLVVLMLAVGWAYSLGPYPLKMTVPGFLVSVTALGLLTYSAGGCAAGGDGAASLLPFGLVMSLWMSLVGWTKDLSDVEGDRVAGRRTLPVLLGERRARTVMAIAVTVVGWGFFAAAGVAGRHLQPAAAVVCCGSVLVAVLLLVPVRRPGRPVRRRPYRAFMITQYAAHATLLLSNVP
ncbi:UbiA family prenyltransferase [Amycolatopsis kentuckyensis]|uniref:UbiA family prenyltransferase n=1 Tax=Amycolatopsis kentuckyensis TaxID=218823 RepID=UPI001FC98858|nr:UbiA family prenyltransferase [Amycolatopsis kentuckyensis]